MKLNNKLTKLIKYYSLINHNYIFQNAPINRYRNKDNNGLALDKSLSLLRREISLIKNCDLKKIQRICMHTALLSTCSTDRAGSIQYCIFQIYGNV